MQKRKKHPPSHIATPKQTDAFPTKVVDLVVIGGGASGLMAACSYAEEIRRKQGKGSVWIVEKASRVGKNCWLPATDGVIYRIRTQQIFLIITEEWKKLPPFCRNILRRKYRKSLPGSGCFAASMEKDGCTRIMCRHLLCWKFCVCAWKSMGYPCAAGFRLFQPAMRKAYFL